MSKFADTVQQDTPRLVILFKSEDGREQFQWGLVGTIPVLTLLGSIVRAQSEVFFRVGDPCDQSAFVIAYDAEQHKTTWFLHPDVLVDPLVGMLETIKATILATHMARQAANQQLILGPDGRPIQRR